MNSPTLFFAGLRSWLAAALVLVGWLSLNADAQIKPILPVVSLKTIWPETTEPSTTGKYAPGRVLVLRTGDASEALTLFFKYGGSATPDRDYAVLPSAMVLEAGVSELPITISALDDDLVEGPETVEIELYPPPTDNILNYNIDPSANTARIVIRDNDQSGTFPTILITAPKSGDNFELGASIEVRAIATDPMGYISRVEFLADDERFGVSEINFIVAPEPGTPIQHAVVWKDAPAGTRELTARSQILRLGYEAATIYWVTSPPVRVRVEGVVDTPVLSVTFVATPDATPDADYAPGHFLIHRTGSTQASLAFAVKTAGTALSGIDYQAVGRYQEILAGEDSLRIKIQAIDDKFPESGETVSLTLLPGFLDTDSFPKTFYKIDPEHAFAELTLFDNDQASEIAALDLVRPQNGDRFSLGDEIQILAVAVDKLADIRKVEFFDNFQRIGVSEHFTKDAVIPGRPREHIFVWKGANAGGHQLLACALDSQGNTVVSRTVQISVSELPSRVELSVVAKDSVAREPSADGDVQDSAVFSIRRVAGPQDVEVAVYYALSGRAQNGIDYVHLSGRTVLPKGAASVEVELIPLADRLVEGDESVLLKLQDPICPAIFPPPAWCYSIRSPAIASAIIRDGRPHGNLPPQVAIQEPTAGARFELNQDIPIVASAEDLDGFIRLVEFFDGREKIGEVNPSAELGVAGLPKVMFRFTWKSALPGMHTLTVRATDNDGVASISESVEIQVASVYGTPVVTVMAWDAHAVEPTRPGHLNTASFQIHRTGGTTDSLLVQFALEGTATPGQDYESVDLRVGIPAGRSAVFVTITPVDDLKREGPETVILRLVPATGRPDRLPYVVGRRGSASAVIADAGWVLPPGGPSCIQLPGGLAHLCFEGTDGDRLRIEASEDLRNWQTVSYATVLDGAAHFVDQDAQTKQSRFYRAVPLTLSEDPDAP